MTYAKQVSGSDDEKDGLGLGFVDAFLANGQFLARVATRGALDAPWGLAWAPDSFGHFGGDLIVGNFGNGRLLAYGWNGRKWDLRRHRPQAEPRPGDRPRPVGHRLRRWDRQQRPVEHPVLRGRPQPRGWWRIRDDHGRSLTIAS